MTPRQRAHEYLERDETYDGYVWLLIFELAGWPPTLDITQSLGPAMPNRPHHLHHRHPIG